MRYFLLALLLLAPFAPAAETFQTYHNSSFDYAIEYPANLLIPQGEADNGDGQPIFSRFRRPVAPKPRFSAALGRAGQSVSST
jgi:hypothetical protein